MIIEKLLDEKNLTETEKQIARYLLDESHDIDNITSTELANKAFASQSTVVRLYKKVGAKSYRDFIGTLSLERHEYFKTSYYFDDHSIDKLTSYDNTKTMVVQLFEKSITNTNLLLNRNIVSRICNRILSAQVIDIYADSLCEVSAQQFQYILQSIGKSCTLQNNINDFYMKNIKDVKSHVAILMNMTNDNQMIIHVANKLKEGGFYSIGIINSQENELNQICQDILMVDSTETEYLDSLSSFISLQYVISFLSSLIYAKTFHKMEQY